MLQFECIFQGFQRPCHTFEWTSLSPYERCNSELLGEVLLKHCVSLLVIDALLDSEVRSNPDIRVNLDIQANPEVLDNLEAQIDSDTHLETDAYVEPFVPFRVYCTVRV